MKRKIYGINLVIIIVFVIGFFVFHYNSRSYDITQIDDFVQATMEKTNTPGTALVILNHNSIEYHTYGYANKKECIEVSSDTNFELGSTTKAFTALAVLMLEDEGKISRQDKIRKYINWFKPEYKGEVQDITIEELLTHKSGIPDWTISKIPEGSDSGLIETAIKNIAEVNLQSKPGTTEKYATINYDILALMIEKVTGEKYQDYVTDNILKPLGMENSYFEINDQDPSGLKAQGYKYEMLNTVPYDAPVYYGNIAAGYLVTNLKDISKWLDAQIGIMNNIPENLNEAINKSHIYDNSEDKVYWAGWNITPKEGIINHSGVNPNFTSQVYIDLNNQKAVFVMCNINGSAATEIGSSIFKMLKGEKVKAGLLIGINEFIDFLSIIICIITIEKLICLIVFKEKCNTKHKKVKVLIGLLSAILIITWPWILHYNYAMLWVWYPPTLIWAEVLIISYIFLWTIIRKNETND